jgi:hypothetical protein
VLLIKNEFCKIIKQRRFFLSKSMPDFNFAEALYPHTTNVAHKTAQAKRKPVLAQGDDEDQTSHQPFVLT